MKTEEVLKLLEKHEHQCNVRYDKIEKALDRFDTKLWGIFIIIIVASGLEQLL
tara:strand:- start:294 stop:452 length:159 start_codon:yes stop_codon:yes gene_type:complete